MAKFKNLKNKINNTYFVISMRVLIVAGILFVFFSNYIFNEARYFIENFNLRPIDNLLAEITLLFKYFDINFVRIVLIIFSFVLIKVAVDNFYLIKNESKIKSKEVFNDIVKSVKILKSSQIFKLNSKYLCWDFL